MTTQTTQKWGRVLICGGTAWTKLGRKAPPSDDEPPNLLEPHILRSLSNVKVVSIHTSCSSCHFVAIDIDGNAYLFGRNGSSCLGITGVDAVSENAPRKVTPTALGAEPGSRFVDAACGRNHTLLVTSDGQVFTAGVNTLGQCGHPPCPEIPHFKAVKGFDSPAIKVSAGISFSLVLTEDGRVYAFGSGEKGQLGNGSTGERITTGNKTAFDIVSTPTVVKDLDDKKIVQIASGQQHSIALDSTGGVYGWGFNGYCRLGLGNQVDALKPKAIPQFSGNGGALFVAAGPTSSAVIDKQHMYFVAGKWKNSGEGSSGSPWSTFRFMPDIMGCKSTFASCGGVTHWALVDDGEDSVMTVAWGQNAANGELGLGVDEPKSATKPTQSVPLTGVRVIAVAAGQNTTLFLAQPNQKMSDLQRHPDVDAPDICVACNLDREGSEPLICDKCDYPYHTSCLDPPLDSIPDGEWFCPRCEGKTGGGKRQRDDEESGKGAKRVRQ